MSQVSIESDQIEEIAGGEFEREPVPKSKLKGWKSFLGMYAGEHAAGRVFDWSVVFNGRCKCVRFNYWFVTW